MCDLYICKKTIAGGFSVVTPLGLNVNDLYENYNARSSMDGRRMDGQPDRRTKEGRRNRRRTPSRDRYYNDAEGYNRYDDYYSDEDKYSIDDRRKYSSYDPYSTDNRTSMDGRRMDGQPDRRMRSSRDGSSDRRRRNSRSDQYDDTMYDRQYQGGDFTRYANEETKYKNPIDDMILKISTNNDKNLTHLSKNDINTDITKKL